MFYVLAVADWVLYEVSMASAPSGVLVVRELKQKHFAQLFHLILISLSFTIILFMPIFILFDLCLLLLFIMKNRT